MLKRPNGPHSPKVQAVTQGRSQPEPAPQRSEEERRAAKQAYRAGALVKYRSGPPRGRKKPA